MSSQNLRSNQQGKTTSPPMKPLQEKGPSEQLHVPVVDCNEKDDVVVEISPGAFAEVSIFLVFLNLIFVL